MTDTPHIVTATGTERAHAALITRFYKNEIARLMHQAEHWAEHDRPLAVHHRLHKADAYFQIVCLFERFATFDENPFEHMRDVLERPAEPAGKYPPSAGLNRYREPGFIAQLLSKSKDTASEFERVQWINRGLVEALKEITEFWRYGMAQPKGSEPSETDLKRVEQIAKLTAEALFAADPTYDKPPFYVSGGPVSKGGDQ